MLLDVALERSAEVKLMSQPTTKFRGRTFYHRSSVECAFTWLVKRYLYEIFAIHSANLGSIT